MKDAPSSVDLFLAGGISKCPDWQAEAVKEAAYQIRWKYEFLRRARVVLFWFPKESSALLRCLSWARSSGVTRA